jgi:putative copper export protein
MIATAPSGEQRLYWPGMWTWTLVRFVHVTGAAVWLGIQVTLLVLVPAMRRQLPAEQVRDIVRRAGRSLAIVGGTALLMIAASGIALARHESSAKAHPGVVGLKEGLLVAIVVLLSGHAYVRGRNARIAASALILVLTLAAILAGAWLTQS